MTLEEHLSLLLIKIEVLKNDLKKAEVFEVRIFSFKGDEVIRKDILEENLDFLKKDGIVPSLDEYKAIRKSFLDTLLVIRNYDLDLNKLKITLEIQKNKIAFAEAERVKLLRLMEYNKKSNVLPFKRK